MKSILKKKIPTQAKTEKIARKFYDDFLAQETNVTLFLEGGLGVGKTLFIRTLLKHAGVQGEIPSPTYTLVQEYDTKTQHFAHFDFYRLTNPQEFFARGFDEIAELEGIKCVEWPDKISLDMQPGFVGPRYTIQLSHGIGVGMRKINIYKS